MALVERKIVEIDADKCNGCGVCADACHEGAIQMVDGKARLVSDHYCDGLGDCLGPCPTGAITLVTRPAEAYDEAAVARRMAEKKGGGCPGAAAKTLKPTPEPLPCGCPGTLSRTLKKPSADACACGDNAGEGCRGGGDAPAAVRSELVNWPVQLKLVPPGAPYLKGADLLLAADCVGFAAPGFHARYLRDKPLIIACPKLEENEPQIVKLAAILEAARPASLTVLRMEVPCCGGLVRVADEAIRRAGVELSVNTRVVGVDGAEQ